MSTKSVDYRVVEMRFDNAQFERGAKESIKTLGNLKEALNLPNTAGSLEPLANASKKIQPEIDATAAGIQKLIDRFGFFGRTAAKIADDVRDALINGIQKPIAYVENAIVSGGIKRAMNIENAHFQLQALLKDEAKVQAVMADAMESVDGTAYAYDEAAKAASQFAASGIQAGEEMLGALKGITGVAAMTNSDFESVSRIFTVVAGNGRLMGDQLLQLSARGLNAASTIADYFREVQGISEITEADIREMVTKGQLDFKTFSDAMTWAFGDSAKRANETFTGSLSNMRSALARIGADFTTPFIEQNGALVKLFNALREKINDVKSTLTFDQQRSAISGLKEELIFADGYLESIYATIKKNGHVAADDLALLESRGAKATDALVNYFNGVSDGSVRANYAITKLVGDLSEGFEVTGEDIAKFVEDGSIDLATFTAAMENEFGNEKTLVKQFTDFFLDLTDSVSTWVSELDVTKPMQMFYYLFESAKNGAKGFLSVLKPLGESFSETFLTFNMDDVLKIGEGLQEVTSKLTLSEKASKNLKDGFKGIMDVGKLIIDIFFELAKAIVPVEKPVTNLAGGFLDLIGLFGRFLSEGAKFVRESTVFRTTFDLLAKVIKMVSQSASNGITFVRNLIKTFGELEGAQKLLKSLEGAFERFMKLIKPFTDLIGEGFNYVTQSLADLESQDGAGMLEGLSAGLSVLADLIDKVDFTLPFKLIKDFLGLFKGSGSGESKGFEIFLTNLKTFFNFGLQTSGNGVEVLINTIKLVMNTFNKFFDWIGKVFGPAIEDFDLGTGAALFTSVTLLVMLTKITKAIEKLTGSIKNVTTFGGVFAEVKNTLVMYQKDLKAEALLKTAEAIGVLAVSLTVLSFADPGRLMVGALALSAVAAVMMFGFVKMYEASNKGIDVSVMMKKLSNDLGSAAKKLGRAMEIKALGNVAKKFGESILMIAASIIAIGTMYEKNQTGFVAGTIAVGAITGVIVGLIGLSALMDKLKIKGEFLKNAGKSLSAIALSLAIGVAAVAKVFKMELPRDYKDRLKVLVGIIGGLGSLGILMGLAANAKGEKSSDIAGKSLISMGATLYVVILAVDKLFKMELPRDYKSKLGILAGLLWSLGALNVLMNLIGGKESKGKGSAMLGMAAFLVAAVASLFVLTILPIEKMLTGALGLAMILSAVAIAMAGASKIGGKDSAAAIGKMITVIVTSVLSLAILALIPFDRLISGATSLGIVLITIGSALKGAGKVTDKAAWKAILSMTLMTVVIAGALTLLSTQPWQNLLVAAGAMSACLIAYAEAFSMISRADEMKPEDLMGFLLGSIVVAIIGASLALAATQPWQSLLVAGGMMAGVIALYGKVFTKIVDSSYSKYDIKKVGNFVVLSLTSVILAAALTLLANQPWQGMLAGAAALSGTILAYALAFEMVLKKDWSDNTPKKVASFLLMVVSVIPIAAALGILANQPWEGLLAAAGSLAATLAVYTACFMFISKVQPNIDAILTFMLGCVAVAAIGAVIGVVANQPVDGIIAASQGIGLLLLEVGAMMLLAAVIGPFADKALIGMAAIDVAIAAFVALMAAIGWATQSPEAQALINGGLDILVQIGSKIGEAIGSFIANMMETISASLPAIGDNLSSFMENLAREGGFLDGLDRIDEEKLGAVGRLAGVVLALSVADFLTGAASLVGLGLPTLGTELSDFASNLEGFITGTQGLDAATMEGVDHLASAMIKLTAADLVNGIMSFFSGNKEGVLSKFGKELISFGPDIKSFAESVEGINGEDVNAAALACETMSSCAKNLQGVGGWIQGVFGNKSLGDFGVELASFGPNLYKFIYGDVKNGTPGVKDVTESDVKGAAAATDAMSQCAKNLQGVGGFLQVITGEKSLEDFGAELAAFGPNLYKFIYGDSEAGTPGVKDVTESDVKGAAAACSAMSECAKNLPAVDGLAQKIFGENKSLSDFGEELKEFGPDLAEFADSVSGITETTVTNVGNLCDILSALANNLPDSNTMWENWFGGGKKTITDFGAELPGFGEDLKDFADKVAGINVTNLETAVTAFQKLVDLALYIDEKAITSDNMTAFAEAIEDMGTDAVKSFCEAFDNGYATAALAINGFVESVILNFQTADPLISEETTKSGENAIDGLTSGLGDAMKIMALTTQIVTVTSGVRTKFEKGLNGTIFFGIGANVVESIGAGIRSRVNQIAQESIKAAQTIVNAAKKELEIASPSKVGWGIGEYWDEGVAGGIEHNIGLVEDASEKSARFGIAPFEEFREAIKNIFNDDEWGNFDPTITPILDLSEVQNGLHHINSLMGDTYSLSTSMEAAKAISSNFAAVKVPRDFGMTDKEYKEKYEATQYQFIQNNYSPKALPRSEIYRDTANQISALRRVVNKA